MAAFFGVAFHPICFVYLSKRAPYLLLRNGYSFDILFDNLHLLCQDNFYLPLNEIVYYSLQFCSLRYLGFVPIDLQSAPQEVVNFLAEQAVSPAVLKDFGSQIKTISEYLQSVHTNWAGNGFSTDL